MSGTLRFEILGPQRAWYADRELDLGPGKQRAVLAVLLLFAGRPVSTVQIVDAVWPEEPPANGPNVVQKYVAGLRRVLEPERSPRTPGQVLTLTDAGYRLRVVPEAVDVVRFERAIRRAGQRRAEGRSADAVAELKAALELWHGEPFTGFVGPVFESARHRLVEMRAAALELRAELELELGRHRELVGELVELVAEFPVRERLRHQLMLALYRSGRQAEALAAYREIGDLLREEYGIEPGDALQELHRRILRSDPTLIPATDSAPAPAAPPAVPAPAGPPPAGPPPALAAPPPTPVGPSTSGPSSTDRPPPVAPAGPSVAGSPPMVAPAGPGSPAFLPGPPAGGLPRPTPPGDGGPLHALPPFLPPPYQADPGRTPRQAPRWLSTSATLAGTALALLSFGCFTWLVILAYAIWRRSWRLGLAAVGYLVCSGTVVWLLGRGDPEAPIPDWEAFTGISLVAVCWLAGAVHVILLSRGVWAVVTGARDSPQTRAAEDRRVRREQSRYLLYHYPAARHELHIGRPDLPRSYDDGGLVDINAVPEAVIAALPGLTTAQSRQVATDRWLRGPFGSMEELAGRCLLPPMVTDALREILVFLPPAPEHPVRTDVIDSAGSLPVRPTSWGDGADAGRNAG